MQIPKKYLAIILGTSIILSFWGCGTKSDEDKSSSLSDTQSLVEKSSEDSEKSQTDDSVKPLDYTWDPYIYSEAYSEYLGEDTRAMYTDMVSAILQRKESFKCSTKFYEQIYTVSSTCFPCADHIVSFSELDVEDESVDYSDQQGTVYLEYLVSEQEQEKMLKEFGNRVEDLIGSSVCEGDSDTVAAIAVYDRFCRELSYDYDAAEADSMSDVSSYRAIMESSGICQSFAPAYAHLCIQLHIPACSTGGLNADNTESHEWTQLKLNGVYYYADPTWETNGGLEWFGFTSQYRESNDGYPASLQNIGNLNLMRADEVPIGDDRFEEFKNFYDNVEITRKGNLLMISDTNKNIYFSIK